MENAVYIILSSCYFFLGILIFLKKYKLLVLKTFLTLNVALPIVNFTQNYHINSQVSIFNFFFIGLYIHFFLNLFFKFKLDKKIIGGLFITFLLLFVYVLHFIFFVDKTRALIDILKDIKPLFTIITAYIFVDYFRDDLSRTFEQNFATRLLLISFTVSTVFYFFMQNSNLTVILSGDAYYKYNELRYLSLGTYFGMFFILYKLISRQSFSIWQILYAVIPLFYTGNRTLIVTFGLVVILIVIIRLSITKLLWVFTTLTSLGTVFVILVNKSVENSPLYRFKALFDPDYLIYALSNRISPFVDQYKSNTFFETLFGKGLGFTFYIPWFAYRENIDDYNIYIDNLYLTLIAKYGILAILIFIIVRDYLRNYTVSKSHAFYYFIFFLAVSFTNAITYQYYFLWLLIVMVLPFSGGKTTVLQ